MYDQRLKKYNFKEIIIYVNIKLNIIRPKYHIM